MRALAVALALSIVTSAWAWSQRAGLPDPMPTHWNVHGRPDGWMPLPAALAVGPLLTLGVPALVAWVGRRAPIGPWRRDALVVGLAGFGGYVQWLMVTAARDGALPDRALLLGLAALWAGLGALLYDVPPNEVLGVRAPWTLRDPALWRRTHHLAAGLMVAGAGLTVAAAAWLPAPAHVGASLAALIAATIVPLAWSWAVARPADPGAPPPVHPT